jgi:hypothetical protein
MLKAALEAHDAANWKNVIDRTQSAHPGNEDMGACSPTWRSPTHWEQVGIPPEVRREWKHRKAQGATCRPKTGN